MAPNFQNGRVYCIRNDKENGKIVYIGSTVRSVAERMADHRRDCRKVPPPMKIHLLMNAVGLEHFHAELLVDFPCEHREQLLAEEGRQIRLHNTVNEGCNVHIAGRTKNERYVDYYENNKEAIIAHVKEYAMANKEAVKTRQQAWRDVNKDTLATKQKAYYEANKEKIYEKHKIYITAKKEETAAYMKNYRETHKAEIAAMKKAWRDSKKK